jgi:siroheme synthase
MISEIITGKVIIAAAGPGDPELITYKAVQCLGVADVILTDRLVNKEINNQAGKDLRHNNPLMNCWFIMPNSINLW